MERDEAKHILELCRPGNDDDRQDPLIAEALALLETDAELRAWFAEQQAVDERISAGYATLEPPADLKASILAGMRAHRLRSESAALLPGARDDLPGARDEIAAPTTEQARRLSYGKSVADERMDPSTTSQSWWRDPWIGIAAVFAILLTIVIIPQQRSAQYAQTDAATLTAGVPDMIQFLARELSDLGSGRGFDKASDQPETLQAYLASVGAPSPSKLPHQLVGNPSLGCFTFDYNGTPMGMICFKNEQVVHLITVRKSDCPRSFQPKEPTLYQVENQAFKAWTEGDHVYILSTKGGKEKLPEVI